MILISRVFGTCSILDTGCPEKEAERLREEETQWVRGRKREKETQWLRERKRERGKEREIDR